ncbi:MAG: FecR domain-containing protein [Gammaproteobacteria bacterium]|nr:FecR domain-containing protein [Gammaproteobacteria bacterium]
MNPSTRIARSKPWAASHSLARLLLVLILSVVVAPTFADPPARAARLSVLSGEIGFAPAGDEDWHAADLNRPLVAGDRLYTERDARTELDLGTAALRLDENSELRMQTLDDRTAQFELPEGTLNLTVRNLYDEQRYEIATPTLTLVVREPGAYRVDARDGSTQVTVFEGDADVYGANDAQQRVTARQSYRFGNADLRDYEAFDLPSPDAFDDWCFARDERYRAPVARQYVSDEVVGYADLDEYGDWDEEVEYGPVWYPRRVASGWAPYRDGHWAWVEPWGWTWVDNAPWGFAPSHYGRWVCVRERWGWIPGPTRVRPVYAPALVAFIGDDHGSFGFSQGNRPVGWYPLGPRDVYEPPYRVSRNYFHNVNVTNIHNHTVVNNTVIDTVYNDYAGGRPTRGMRHHAYRDRHSAVTAVTHDTFGHARPARPSRSLQHDVIVHRQPVPKVKTSAPRPSVPHGHADPTPSREATHDRHDRPAIKAPARVSRPPITAPAQTIKRTVVQPHKVAPEPRRPKPVPETFDARGERRHYSPPVEPRRDYRQTRQVERPPQSAAAPSPRRSAPIVATDDEMKKARSKTREHPRGGPEDTRRDIARGTGSVMPMR